MTGSLQIKGNKYYAVVRIPDETGKERQKWICTNVPVSGNNKRKAQQEMRRILTELENSMAMYSTEIHLTVWLEKWMEQKRQEVRLNTWEGYRFYLDKHIIPYFEPLKLTLSKVTPQHIQEYFNYKLLNGQSVSTVKKHNAVIRGALQEAYKKSMITCNPADRTTLPKLQRYKGQAYTVEQANILVAALEGDILKPVVILGLFYGLRKSEALGLRWRDIDFKAGTITVRNTVTRMKTLIEHEQTKSKASERVLFMMPETKPYFQQLYKTQLEHRLLLGADYIVSDHICTWPDGKLLSPDYVSQHFKKFLRKNNLPIIRFHDLRHTAGSLLLNSGMNIKQIQEFLGHEEVTTTLNIYTHLNTQGKQETAVAMGKMLKINAC